VPSTGVIAYHPSTFPDAIDAMDSLHTRLREERPGYILWAVGAPSDAVLSHIEALSKGSMYHVVPLLLAPGKHLNEDVKGLVHELSEARPDLVFQCHPTLLENPEFITGWIENL